MRDFYIWILSVVMAVSLGWGLAGNWGNVIGLYYVLASGIVFGIYRLTKRLNKKKFKSTKINLGTATGFMVPTNNSVKNK